MSSMHRIFSSVNIKFIKFLSGQTWERVYTSDDVNAAYNIFSTTLNTLFQEAFPFKKVWSTYKTKGDFTHVAPALRDLREQVSVLGELAKKYDVFKGIINSKYQNKLSEVKQDINDERVKTANNKNKEIWRIIKSSVTG